MLFTLYGMLIDVRLEQSLNAHSPMLDTLSGMWKDVRPILPSKALFSMLVTLSGMTVFLHPTINLLVEVSMMALQLFRESYVVFPLSTAMDSSPSQPANAPSPMLVTLLGILMNSSP